MKQRMIEYYLRLARETSKLSRAVRLQVGAIIVTSDDCVLYGWNGTPTGWDNNCENRVWMDCDAGGWLDPLEIETRWPYEEYSDEDPTALIGRYYLKTKDEVLHAEMNAMMKLAKSTLSGKDATLFMTHSPCIHCAKAIYQSGISSVYYIDDYRSNDGVEFLGKCGVVTKKYPIN